MATTQEVNVSTSSVFSAMLERIGWEPLEGHRAKARVTILYWIVHNLVDIPVANHLTQSPTSGSFIRTDFGVPACFLP